MISAELKKEIAQFEEDKQKAIKSYERDGKYLVIAGPGTGKTFMIIKRIQAILEDKENGTIPSRILCLTFSDAAANEMVTRLEKEHVKNASDINVATFHSFCLNLMQENPDLFDIANKSQITNIQKQAIVKECLDELSDGNPEIEIDENEDSYTLENIKKKSEKDGISNLRTDNNLYGKINDIVAGIEAIKHNRLTPEKIEENIKNNPAWFPMFMELSTEEEKEKHCEKIATIYELLRIYKKYQEKSQEYIDFDDMINFVLEKFETDSDFLKHVGFEYDFVMVDEYQDTNKSQNDIVFNLAKTCKNILVVGDDDQIIYAFQGASLETIDNFRDKFQPEEFIFTENRRSTQTILDVSEELAKLQDDYHVKFKEDYSLPDYLKEGLTITEKINKKKEMLENVKAIPFRLPHKMLKASNENLQKADIIKPVLIKNFDDDKNELEYITKQIKKIIDDDTKCPKDKEGNKKLSEIAILTKSNADAYKYANKLKQLGIRNQLVGGKNIFETNSVKTLIAFLQFFSNPEQNPDKLYKYLLYKPFHIHPKDFQILNSKEIKRLSGSSLIRRMREAISMSEKEEKKTEGKNESKILANREKFDKFIKSYEAIEDYIAGESVQNSVIKIANILGITTCYLSILVNRTENQEALNRFFTEAALYEESHSQPTLKEFTRYITMLIESGIEIKTDKADKPYNAVQVSTLHASKGREFEYVFMPSVNAQKFESNTKDENKEIVPLEYFEIITPLEGMSNLEKFKDKKKQAKFRNSAKLIYVGMTRAKHYLFMSYILKSRTQPSWFIEKLMASDKVKSLIDTTLVEYSEEATIDKNIQKQLQSSIEKLRGLNIPEAEEELKKIEDISELLEFTACPDEAVMLDYDYEREFGEDYINNHIPEKYSVSSFNTYLSCPKKFLYKYILQLLPEEKLEEDTPEEDIGNEFWAEWGLVIHYALENYVRDVIKSKKHFDYSVFEKYFDEKQKELIKDADISTIEKKKENLKKYFEELIKTPAEKFFDVERRVPNPETENGKKYIKIENIDFKGTIDRIDKEIINGEEWYSIYDYKTGTKKDKKKAEVTSVPTDPNKPRHAIYNQLALYKYVLETEYNVKINKVGIEFPEDVKSSFTIDELSGEEGLQKCKEVVEKFKKTIDEDIKQKHIFDCVKGCSKGDYCFCEFKEFCKSEVI